MANVAGVCNSFKKEILQGVHNFTPAAQSFKMALYLAAASNNPGTTAYASTNEVTSANYSAGGAAVTNAVDVAVPTQSTAATAYWTPSASVSWSTVTFTGCDCALLYNTSQSNKAVAVFTFGSSTVAGGNFTLTMPTNDASNGLIRIS